MNRFAKGRLPKLLAIAALMMSVGFTATAQSENNVTIKFDDGNGIDGTVVGITETAIRLDTIMGPVTIPFEGVTCIGAACPDPIRFEADANPIELTSVDGATKMVGNLLEIDDGEYVVATIIGEVRIPVDQVTCVGAGCWTPVEEPKLGGKVVLTSGNTILEGILKGLDEESYLVEVASFGELRVPREFTCEGDGCPSQ